MAFANLVHLWNKWAIQILVLLSLGLQVGLVLFAGIRRRRSHALLRLFLWLFYMLADSTAIYTLAHLSPYITAREHKLVLFWAPFLLLHLGGPDNITAYALQDNQLWLRHLQHLVVQVLAAGNVLYGRIVVDSETTALTVATVLMFVVGLAKYGERTWALKCSNFSSIRSSLKEGNQLHRYEGHLQGEDHRSSDEEYLLQRAHSLFHICKRGIVYSVIDEDTEKDEAKTTKKIINNLKPGRDEKPKRIYKVMEMELSLMYDILYTKATIIHTWIGYCIRALSSIAIVVSFLLFHFSSSKHGQKGVDIAVTYILLGGTLLMETTSLLSALGSSWALAFLTSTRWSWLRHVALCTGRWRKLRRAVVALRRLVAAVTGGIFDRSRNWSGTIGQFNLLYFRAAQVNPMNRRFGWISNKLGLGDWWNITFYSWDIKIPEIVKERTLRMVSKDDLNTMGLLRHKWGELALKKCPTLVEKLKNWWGVDFHESIIIWHVATDLILAKRKEGDDDSAKKFEVERVQSIRALSNYMMFLLMTHPDMLPGLPHNWLLQRTCDNLDDKNYSGKLISSSGGVNNLVFRVILKILPGHHNRPTSVGLKKTNELANILFKNLPTEFDPKVPRLTYARKIAKAILDWKGEDDKPKKADPMKVLLDLWIDFLIYAANRCNRESHAKKLNTGTEFTTIVWLLVEHIFQTK